MLRWSKKLIDFFGVAYPDDPAQFFSTRNDILYGKILVLTGCVSFFLFTKDFVDQGFAPVPLMTGSTSAVIVLAFFLRKRGHVTVSKILVLLLLNILIAILCAVVPKERAAFVYFFPLVTLAYAIFDSAQRRQRLIFVLLPTFLLLLLVFTDFKPLGDIHLSRSGLGQHNLVINIIACVLVIAFCFDFMGQTNRASERMLLRMADEIREKNEHLEKINGELDRFVYRTSHDLRAPLLSIQGLVKVALSEAQNEKVVDYFKMIGARSVKLDEFIQEIIEYSRNARTDLHAEHVNVRELIDEVIHNFNYVEGASQIRFNVIAADTPMLLDKGRVKIVLSNLISNAIKYHNLRKAEPWINVETEHREGQCHIRVSDNGMGIRPEYGERIFDMFFRATEASTGSGLGLYIVKEVTKKMQGTVTMDSEFGKGSNFVVTLPVLQTVGHAG